jgi:hypothetical protein
VPQAVALQVVVLDRVCYSPAPLVKRLTEDHAADQSRWGQLQERSLALTEQGQAQARQVNERFIELASRRVELAEKLVAEQQRTNALLEQLLARLGGQREGSE